MVMPVIVYGNGDLFRELFNAIAVSMHDSSYHYLLHLSIILAGTCVIIRYSAERNFASIARWLMAFYLAFFVCFKPTRTVEIVDQVNLGKAYAVSNVPLGIALLASYTSRVGAGLTQLIEKNFSLPDDLKYSHTGMVMASRLVLNSSQFEVTDPNFMQSMQGFVHQCVFYDLLLNRYSLSDLMSQTNLWNFLSSNASKARSFLYYPMQGGSPSVVTCDKGSQSLTKEWKDVMDSVGSHYGVRLFPYASDPKTELLSNLPEAYQFLANTSQSATEIMQQNLIANAIQNGVLQMGTTTNSPAALENYAFTKAQLQKRLSNETMADQAAYWLPLMKNVLEMVLYGSFVFVFLLFLFPFGVSIAKNYCASLIFLQLWAPIYAILNLAMNFYSRYKTLAAFGGVHGEMGLSLYTQAGIQTANADIANLAGYLSLSVPLLAVGVLRGMMSVVTQAAQYIGGVTQSASISGASEAVSGNYSMGNINYSNQSSFNTNANHFDTSARSSSGMATTQMPGGSTLAMTPDGTLVMNNQSGISNLGVSANLAESVRASYMKQAEMAENAAFNQSRASQMASTEGMRNLYELGTHDNKSNASSEGWAYSTSENTSQALQNVHRLTQQFAENHNISYGESANVLSSAYGKASAGLSASTGIIGKAGASGGLSVDYQHGASNTDTAGHNTLYSQAENFVRDTNYSESVNVVAQAAHDHTLRATSDEGNRLIENMGASFDKSQSLRNETVSSLQQSESYRQMASFAEENSVNINSNASQIIFENLKNKEGMKNAEIENLMTHHPEIAQAKAQEIAQVYTEQLAGGFGHGLPTSKDDVINDRKINDGKLDIDEKALQSTEEKNNKEISEKAKSEGLTPKKIVDESAKDETDKSIQSQKEKLFEKDTEMEKEANRLYAKTQAEKDRKRAGTTGGDLISGIDVEDHD